MSVDFFKSLVVNFADDGEADILARHNVRIRRPINKRVIPLVINAIDGGRIVGIGSRDDNASDAHHVKLQPRRIEPRDHFRGRDQNFLPLMSAHFAARALILDMDRADFVFDEFLNQVANMMLPSVAGIPIGYDHGWVEVDRRALLSLRRSHSHPIGSLNFVLVEQRAHP